MFFFLFQEEGDGDGDHGKDAGGREGHETGTDRGEHKRHEAFSRGTALLQAFVIAGFRACCGRVCIRVGRCRDCRTGRVICGLGLQRDLKFGGGGRLADALAADLKLDRTCHVDAGIGDLELAAPRDVSVVDALGDSVEWSFGLWCG